MAAASSLPPIVRPHCRRATSRQMDVLRFIHSTIVERGVPPTLREIGKHINVRSTNGVTDHLVALERKGLVTRDKDAVFARAMRITPAGFDALVTAGVNIAGPTSENAEIHALRTEVVALREENRDLRAERMLLVGRIHYALRHMPSVLKEVLP